MRRKSTRTSSKSNSETKTEPRKHSRTSERKESPSESSYPENLTASKFIENAKESVQDQDNDNPSNLSGEVMDRKNISMELVDCESTSNVHYDSSNVFQGGHTPPHIGSTGNEAPDSDEVDGEKGKCKGINSSQVEENSEIKMNSVTSDSAEEGSTKNDVIPEVSLSHSASSNDNLVQTLQNIKEQFQVKQPDVDNKTSSSNEDKSIEIGSKEEINTDVECSSVNEIVEIEKIDSKGIVTENLNDGDLDDDQAEEGEIRESKSDEENEKNGLDEKLKKSAVRIKLRRDSFFKTIEQLRESETPEIKKIKWNPEQHHCLKLSYSDLYKLCVDDFKALSSDLKLADEKDIKLEDIYKPKPIEANMVKKRTVSMDIGNEDVEKPVYSKQSSTASSEDQDSTNIIALNRKISIVDDTASKLKPPPSPAKQPVSSILFISNLVRPFTIKQLKELLERTGEITADGFWTDRIKSKCYVQYTTSEDAEATRNALHGVNWPIGNGKKLIIEFATEEEMKKARNPPIQPAPLPPHVTPPRSKTPQKENTEPVHETRNGDRKEERRRRNSERERERGRTTSTRDWNVGKDTRKERSRSRSKERRRKHSGRRSITPLEDFIARKQRKLEESIPQKLMDDLFQRTKTMPCLYWQPLSPEEISVKQQQRLSKMEEHKRRLEEISRNRGARDPGRGAYRRRYD